MKYSEFDIVQNRNVWDDFCKYIANNLAIHDIPLENLYFVNSPGFLIFFTENDRRIIQRPASDYSEFITRRVLVEKSKINRYECYFHKKRKKDDKIVSQPHSVMSYRLNWKKSFYGEEFDLMESLRIFLKSKNHLSVFLYIDSDFFETIKKTSIIRIATIDINLV